MDLFFLSIAIAFSASREASITLKSWDKKNRLNFISPPVIAAIFIVMTFIIIGFSTINDYQYRNNLILWPIMYFALAIVIYGSAKVAKKPLDGFFAYISVPILSISVVSILAAINTGLNQ
jgi:hypothetical protein